MDQLRRDALDRYFGTWGREVGRRDRRESQGTFNVLRRRGCSAQRFGTVVNITSINGLREGGQSNYVASKAGVGSPKRPPELVRYRQRGGAWLNRHPMTQTPRCSGSGRRDASDAWVSRRISPPPWPLCSRGKRITARFFKSTAANTFRDSKAKGEVKQEIQGLGMNNLQFDLHFALHFALIRFIDEKRTDLIGGSSRISTDVETVHRRRTRCSVAEAVKRAAPNLRKWIR